MELEEMKSLWQQNKAEVSIRINKVDIHAKLRSSLDKVRIKNLLSIIFMSLTTPVIILLVVIPHLKNDDSVIYYLGLVSFFTAIIISYAAYVYYYIRLLKMDTTHSIFDTQKEITRLEIFKRKLHKWSYITLPFLFVAAFKIFGVNINKSLGTESIIMLLLIAIIGIVSYVVRMKVVLPGEFRDLKSQLDEMEEEEKNLSDKK